MILQCPLDAAPGLLRNLPPLIPFSGRVCFDKGTQHRWRSGQSGTNDSNVKPGILRILDLK